MGNIWVVIFFFFFLPEKRNVLLCDREVLYFLLEVYGVRNKGQRPVIHMSDMNSRKVLQGGTWCKQTKTMGRQGVMAMLNMTFQIGNLNQKF